MSLKVALVAEGDANTRDCWSGSGVRFLEALRAAGVHVDVYEAELRSWRRALAAAYTLRPDKARWRQRFLLGPFSFALRSAHASRSIEASGTAYDAIIQ